jgi:hypothetical protein
VAGSIGSSRRLASQSSLIGEQHFLLGVKIGETEHEKVRPFH